jgi:DnaK suppressor protein
MDDQRARELIQAERANLRQLLAEKAAAATSDRDAADERGADIADAAEPLTTEGTDDAIRAGIEDRLAALDRAEQRLDAGTYGRSVRSGRPIPDERLEADPAAELTVDEAAQG